MFTIRLNDHFEIANYIEELASKPIDKQLVEDYFWGCNAILKECLVKNLFIGDEDHHLPDKALEKKYLKLPLETIPPIIVENNKIVDGNHRYRVLEKLKVKKVWIYRIEK